VNQTTFCNATEQLHETDLPVSPRIKDIINETAE
jgi:hypothetical protein